jgi:hypothetical protein
MRFKGIFAIAFLALSALSVSADELALSAAPVKKSNFVLVGTTAYVSGHFSKWLGRFDYTWVPKSGESKIEKIVLYNVTSERQDGTGAAEVFKKRAALRGWNIVVVGRCDLFCARFVTAGKTRTLAPGAYFDLQTPIDYDTKKLETRFPGSQFAIYETIPLAVEHKAVFFEAFSQGGETGGLRVDATSARFCKERGAQGEKDCKDYPLNAFSMGLITDAEPAVVELPENLF